MAKWAEIQFAFLINEQEVAFRKELLTAMRNDEYGRGFLKFRANYKLTHGSVIQGNTPFTDPKNPLSDEFWSDEICAIQIKQIVKSKGI